MSSQEDFSSWGTPGGRIAGRKAVSQLVGAQDDHYAQLAGTSHHPNWCRQATRMLGSKIVSSMLQPPLFV